MAPSEDLIDFDIIENQKENIQSLPGGRSARSLATLFSASPLDKLLTPTPSDTRNLNDTLRQEFEEELANVNESDDPLDIYDRYVKWTFDAYPSAQATPSSGLLPLLERATKAFLTSTQYKNDPRYLKLWLSYIRFFSETPRETFAFLARHNIGDGLALFYEEFAAWLEGAGRWAQAEEIYRLGIDKDARPAARLLRKFNEFQQRLDQRPEDNNEPSSPALPTVRPALAAKIDPFASAVPVDPQAPRPNSGVSGGTTKSGRQKLTIFSDADEPAPVLASRETKGWDSIGSLAERKKENIVAPKPWVGETLKGGMKKSGTKMAVFKDESLPRFEYPQVTNPREHQVTVNLKGRRERIVVDLEAIYPSPDVVGSELSIEELIARRRGLSSIVWEPELPLKIALNSPISHLPEGDDSELIIEEITKAVSEKLVIARDPVALDENGAAKEPAREGRGRRMKIKEVNETQIIKAKLSSPSGPKLKKRKASKEQTMTLHTRAATDDIYDLFSQPLKPAEEEEESEESEGSEDDDGDTTDGDYTSGGESTGTNHLISTSEAGDDETTDVKSVSEWSEFTARKHVPNIEDEEDTRSSRFTEADDDDFEPSINTDFEMKRSIAEVEGGDDGSPTSPSSPRLPPATRTSFVPMRPVGYEPVTNPYRDPLQVSQNRLPWMTPIAEKTESSLSVTAHKENKFLDAKTPSKGDRHKPFLSPVNDGSSPYSDVDNEELQAGRIPQPMLSKTLSTNSPPESQLELHSVGGAITQEIEQKLPVIKDLQCNPVDGETRIQILAGLEAPLTSYNGYFDHSHESMGRKAEIQKFTKIDPKKAKTNSEKTATIFSMPPTLQFPETDRQYIINRKLGGGAYGDVYLVESLVNEADENELARPISNGTVGAYNRNALEAVKMEIPPTPWEFYIMRQASRRLDGSRPADSIIDVYAMHLYSDECYLIEEYRDQGTLLDIINIVREQNKTAVGPGVMDESQVMFFTIELFRTIEALHARGILHGDLKADNCLVRLDPITKGEVWASQYNRDGTEGWDRKGISLIDFGRGIDMKVFQPNVTFFADWVPGPGDCAEMHEQKAWTYHIDYHGLAGIIHTMLFGEYIKTIAENKSGGIGAHAKKYRIKENLKRYWQKEIWGAAFDLLLNPGMHVASEEGNKLPVLNGMASVRESMENWLEANCKKGDGLQTQLKKLEHAVNAKKKNRKSIS